VNVSSIHHAKHALSIIFLQKFNNDTQGAMTMAEEISSHKQLDETTNHAMNDMR
jgi:hypothetical protein